ncbi:hypothetical protein JCM8547_005257 [Rhodosporidiobolus lusitaniae]
MLILTPRALVRRPLHSLHLSSLSPSTTAVVSPQGGVRAFASRRNGTGDPAAPSRPQHPAKRVPSHRPAPHRFALTSPKHLFQARTRWLARTLAEGHCVPRTLLYKLLDSRDIPPDVLALWVEVIARKDPVWALGRLGLLESAHFPLNPAQEEPPCPTWLYLSLPGMVSQPAHAPYLASQLLTPRFASLEENDRGLFVARCIQHFLKVRHYVALREIVEWVAYTPSRRTVSDDSAIGLSSSRSFGRILTALSSERIVSSHASATPDAVLRPLLSLISATMTSRNVRRTLETFLPLFSPKLISREPDEAIRLLWEMRTAGFEPGTEVLHAVLRVYALAERSDGVEAMRRSVLAVSEGGMATLLEVDGGSGSSETVPLDVENGAEAALSESKELADGVEEGWEEDDRKEQQLPEQLEAVKKLRLPPAEQMQAVAALTGRVAAPPAFLRDLLPAEEKKQEEEEAVQSRLSPSSSSPSTPSLGELHPTDLPLIYETTTLLDTAVSLAYFQQLEHAVTNRARMTSFPEPPFPFDTIAWIIFLGVVGRLPSVSTESYLRVFSFLETAWSTTPPLGSPRPSYLPSHPTLRTYTTVLRALLRRHAYKSVLSLWRSLESRGWRPDAHMLDCVVRALCAINRDQLALRTLTFYGHRPGLDPPDSLLSLRAPNPQPSLPPLRSSVRLDAVPLNSLLAHLSRSGQYDAAFDFFKRYEERFAVKPDAATVSIMLDTARFASAAAGKGFGPGFEDLSSLTIRHPEAAGSGEAEEADGRGIGGARGRMAVVDDRWNGVPAAKRMERFVWVEILEGNWQDADLEDPFAGPGGGKAEARATGGLSSWLAKLGGGGGRGGRGGRGGKGVPSAGDEIASSATSRSPKLPLDAHRLSPVPFVAPPLRWQPFSSTLSPTPPPYPHLHPTDRVFRSLIQLTGYHSDPRSIPHILAWMKHVHVRPSRWTLALAMMYVDGESGAGLDPHKVARFKAWLVEWLDEEHVPREGEIAWVRRGGKREGVPELR